jgi:hypothetical protein
LGGHGVLFLGFVNGRIKTTFYETLALGLFMGLQRGKKPLGGFISAPFGSPFSFLTPKG